MEDGKRVYTLKKSNPDEKPTNSAHPGTFAYKILYVQKLFLHAP